MPPLLFYSVIPFQQPVTGYSLEREMEMADGDS